jgi:hypothetical protein
LKFQSPNLVELPKFKTALEYRDRFTFGHEKLDTILDLHLDDTIGIFGQTKYTNILATRLVVRALLPRNHGGVDAESVMVIDADNSSSPIFMLILQENTECIIVAYYVRCSLPDSSQFIN